MDDNNSAKLANMRVPPSLFHELPSEMNARFSALSAIREAFEVACHMHSQATGMEGEASDPKSVKP
jgi:hypothetical protein